MPTTNALSLSIYVPRSAETQATFLFIFTLTQTTQTPTHISFHLVSSSSSLLRCASFKQISSKLMTCCKLKKTTTPLWSALRQCTPPIIRAEPRSQSNTHMGSLCMRQATSSTSLSNKSFCTITQYLTWMTCMVLITTRQVSLMRRRENA